jgi:hypothetical protein
MSAELLTRPWRQTCAEQKKQIAAMRERISSLELSLAEATTSASAWRETAARHCRNEAFYRDLVTDCGYVLGGNCFVQNDGGVVSEPLALRVPEVVREVVADLADAKMAIHNLEGSLAEAKRRERTPGTVEVCERCRAEYGEACTVAPADSQFACEEAKNGTCPLRSHSPAAQDKP